VTATVRTEPAGLSLADWTTERIDAECINAYDAYLAQVRLRHVAYFAARPEQRSATRAFAARTRQAAFPDGWEHLAGALAAQAWHRHHLSAGSSQVLAIALLASAARADPSLRWLSGARRFRRALTLFEVELAPTVLRERPRQTSIDWLVLDRHSVIAAEAKFTERGLGQCSCEEREAGLCSERVLQRPYWDVASRDVGLHREAASASCCLSLAYQAVRNVAAAQAIAGERRSTAFLLLYDARNPYFAGALAWPGWIRMLSQLMSGSATIFMPVSWQGLLARAPVPDQVRAWAWEKHGLEPASVA
jgi:Restriction Endonuclease associating with ARP